MEVYTPPWLMTETALEMHTSLGSGQIEFEEFIVLCSRFMEEEPVDNAVVVKELKEIFNLYDKDGNGYTDIFRQLLYLWSMTNMFSL